MLFMVIEHFRSGDPTAVGMRFQTQGRMLPDDVHYVSSWMETTGARCFQIMEAPNRECLDPWTRNWSDLVDFEIIPILSSAAFWQASS